MGNLNGFNATAIGALDPLGPIPENTYRMVVSAADLKPNRAQTGRMVELEFRVVEGPHEGRRLWERWEIEGHDERSVKKGLAKFASLCRAVGLPEPGDTANLVGRRAVARVGLLPARDGFEARNVLRAILEPESQGLAAVAETAFADDVPF